MLQPKRLGKSACNERGERPPTSPHSTASSAIGRGAPACHDRLLSGPRSHTHTRAEMPYMSAEMRGLSGGNHLRPGIVPESQPYRGLTPRERAGHLSPGPSLLSRPGSATNSPRLPRQQPAAAFTASMRGLRIPEPLPQRGLTPNERANPTQACRGPSLLYRDRFGQSSSAGGPGFETRRGFEAKMVLPLPELPFAAVRALPAKYASQLRTVLIQPR